MSARSPGGGVPRTVKGLSVVSLFNDLASEMVYPLLPALVTGPLGAVLSCTPAPRGLF